MLELIDRQALIKDMCNNKTEAKCPCYPNCYPCDFSEARRIIDIQPTIEPEVRHGRWILCKDQSGVDNDNNNYAYFCSNCHYQDVHSKSAKVNFCWNCGARMDGGAENV